MMALNFRTIAAIALLFFWTHPALAGTVDDYYLQQFGEVSSPVKANRLTLPSDSSEQPRCGMPLKKKLRQEWNSLEASTRKILAKQLAAPILSAEASIISSGGHFRLHYATSGSDAPPSADLNLNFTPDWIETVAATFEDVYSYYQNQGYRMPPTAGGYYEIYLRDLAPLSLYGQTTSTTPAPAGGYPNSFGSYMEIDNNFTDSKFVNAFGGPYSALQSLQITAAHEFHHSIQYGYNYYFDIWYAEASSTWFEDEKFDTVNQLYNYLPAWFNNSTKSIDIPVDGNALTTGAGYSRWLFNRYLAERFGSGVIRNAWQSLATISSPDGSSDIPMTPVLNTLLSSTYGSTLAKEFNGFATSAYLRDWVSHGNEIARIHDIVPVASYGSYPVNSTRFASANVTLPHYSFAYYTFVPTFSVTTLTITLSKTSGMASTVLVNRNGFVTEILANSGGNSYTVNNFATFNPATDEVVLLLSNITAFDNHAATFSTDGNSPIVTEPTVNAGTSSGSSSSSGCFIATAAYGSYLHPHVQTLRDFRDNYLMTNPAGRGFVALYYSVSPPIADYIAQHDFLRSLVRLCLTPLIVTVTHPLLTLIILSLLLCGMLFYLKTSKKLSLNHHSSEVV